MAYKTDTRSFVRRLAPMAKAIRSTAWELINLPVFFMFTGIAYVAVSALGFVFFSQSLNIVVMVIVAAIGAKDMGDLDGPDENPPDLPAEYTTVVVPPKRQTNIYNITPLLAFWFVFASLAATVTGTLSFNIMAIVVLILSMTVLRQRCNPRLRTVLSVIYGFFVAVAVLILVIGMHLHIVTFSVETARITEGSPYGAHKVVIVRDSHGMMGGRTSVTIRHSRAYNLLIGELRRRCTDIFVGNYGAFSNIDGFRWDGDSRFYMYINEGGNITQRVFYLRRGRWVEV